MRHPTPLHFISTFWILQDFIFFSHVALFIPWIGRHASTTGLADGLDVVGACDGDFDGADVVGVRDGLLDGDFDGADVVGVRDGLLDGDLDGDFDGADVAIGEHPLMTR